MSMRNRRFLLPLIALVLLDCILIGLLFREPLQKMFYPKKYADTVERYATLYDLPPHLVFAVIKAESGFDPDAVSHAGAMGLMQIIPSTFLWLTDLMGEELEPERLYDPEVNIRYGCYFLRYLFNLYEDETLVLAAYNAGMGNVAKWLASEEYSEDGKLTNIPFEETKNYINRVLHFKDTYDVLYPEKGTNHGEGTVLREKKLLQDFYKGRGRRGA